jgi:hypothetical protein
MLEVVVEAQLARAVLVVQVAAVLDQVLPTQETELLILALVVVEQVEQQARGFFMVVVMVALA